MADVAPAPAPQASQSPATFDIAGARDAGYSDEDIAGFLASQKGFDIAAAQQAGYNNTQISNFLATGEEPETATLKAPMALMNKGDYSAMANGSYYELPDNRIYQKAGAPSGKDAFIEQRGPAALPNPQQPESSWLDTATGVVKDVPQDLKAAVGGMMRALAEKPAEPDLPGFNPETDPQGQAVLEQGKRLAALSNVPGTLGNTGKQLFADAEAHIKANAPNVPDNSAKAWAYDIGNGLAQMTPLMAASAVTKSPIPAMAGIAGEVYGETYGQARDAGRTPEQARGDALFSATANVIPAAIPLHAIMKPGEKFLGRVLKTAAGFGLQNLMTTALQKGYDAGVLDQNMTWGDAMESIAVSGIQGVITGGVFGLGQAGAEAAINRIAGSRPGSGTPPAAAFDAQGARDAGYSDEEIANFLANGTGFALDAARQAGYSHGQIADFLATGQEPEGMEANGEKVAPTPEQAAAPILAADTVDDAIQAAQDAVQHEPIDIEAEGMRMQAEAEARESAEAGRAPEPPHRELMATAGQIQQIDGGYVFRDQGNETTTPLKLWDENASPETPEEGQGAATTTISPDLAAAQREHYGRLGVNVVYFQNDPRIPFDGAVDPNHPDTLFLSNDPTRNAAQVGAHEFTHVLGSTTLPDGTTLGDMLHEQIRQGITQEGMAYAQRMFGATAPDRAQYPEGPEGDTQHANVVTTHLIRELGADLGGEAPKFESFAPQVVEAVRQRYGTQVAKSVLQKFLAGIKSALNTIRGFFSGGSQTTASQNWVTNLSDIHATLAQSYAERYGTQLEKEQARVQAMRVQAQRQVRQRAAAVERPETLFDAIRRLGGIRDVGGDVNQVMQNYRRTGARVDSQLEPLSRRVVRPDGRSPDEIRSALQEEGWFGPEGQHSFRPNAMPAGSYPGNDVRDLYGLMDREARGHPVYHPEMEAKMAEAREGQRIAEQNAEYEESRREILLHAATEYGQRLTDEDVGDIMARMGKGIDLDSAIVEHLDGPTLFSPKSSAAQRETVERMEPEQRYAVSNLIEAATGGHRGTGDAITARLLSRITEKGIKQLKNLIPEIEENSIFPRTLATLDDLSARFWNAWEKRSIEGHRLEDGLRRVVSDSLVNLPAESRDRVYGALELARKWNWRPPDDGRPIRVKNSSYWQARKSKVGDDYVLTKDETKAFHDLLRLGDEGWETFMGALARREGWNGEPDPEAIRRAANEAGTAKLPEGKRLMRLADLLEHAQLAMQRPYFPAMRFGDYFIAVRPKIGKDETSTGGNRRIEWFETVEKSILHDLMGKARQPAAETENVKQALVRIKAMQKPDGSIAFPEDKYDFEVGDLRLKPDVLRNLNIPAIEKLFMLMERGVTKALQDKIIAGSHEGLDTGDAANLKGDAQNEALGRYKATLGEATDALLDAIYEDLLAGFKRQAQLAPGYSPDFDRAIGSHIGHVSRNAADIIHRNDIEDTYQGIQDAHPHALVRNYWQEWRKYQENPALNPLARAAGATNRFGAVWVMGANPSTSLIIQAHAPLMATPVLGVGGGMVQAGLQMSRALREAYGAITFDKRNGASIDTDKLGKTDRERALIADLDRAGLNHSIGADDIRAINDRQAGLWGKAAPTMRTAMQIATSNISVVDQANRNAIALAAHRMAMQPKVLEKMAAPWIEHNAVFREMVKSEGLIPENFTRFMLSEGAGSWGKLNQAPMMREGLGTLLFALHGFQTRFLSTALKLTKNMGPAGKVAAAWMMGALWAATGVYGLPFTQDLETFAGWAWKSLTGEDPMIDAHIRKLLADVGLGKIGSEILLRGPLSVMLGVDLASRMGFGDIITRSMDAGDALGTIPLIVAGRLRAAYDRERSGQGLEAAGAELLPAALRNPARAVIVGHRGEMSEAGHTEMQAKSISLAHQILRSIGLSPLSSTQARARSEYFSALDNRDKELRQLTETKAANLIVQATAASDAGDHDRADALQQQVADTISGYNKAHWQAPVTSEGIQDAIMQATNPELARKVRLPATLRGEAEASPYP